MSIRPKQILLVLIILLALILRVWRLDLVPISLFGDELDVGYQAYSILKTGKDYSGNFFPLHFKSLAEWRTPLYLYSSVPTVALFGINAWGVRLPAAIFGVLGVLAFYLLVKELTKNESLGLLSAFLLAVSPWHLHYSRAGFEVTEMLFLYILGVFFLLLSLRGKNTLWLAAILLALTPWAYNTAKLFLPLTIIVVLIIWRDKFKAISKQRLILALIAFSIFAAPYTFNTLFGGGTQRIQSISIFNNPTIIPQMGFDRLNDIKMRNGVTYSVSIVDKLFHNQIISFSEIFSRNYFQAFSTNFLFTDGDVLNLRQASGSEFYKIESIFLLLGLFFLIVIQLDKKVKTFLFFWLIVSPIPSSLTKGGGDHATRLILMLPVLTILIAFGMYYSYVKINQKFKSLSIILISMGLFLSFLYYQHNYWIHYPWESERWWQAGFENSIKLAVKESSNYEKVILSSANEPALVFFLGWSMYPPEVFQKEYSSYALNKEIKPTLSLGKFEFPPVGQGLSLYEIGSKLSKKVLYVATAKEVVVDLNKEPERLPKDISLVKTINYPSGAPAFYFFTKP